MSAAQEQGNCLNRPREDDFCKLMGGSVMGGDLFALRVNSSSLSVLILRFRVGRWSWPKSKWSSLKFKGSRTS